MRETLFSQSWYRVESIKPILRSHVKIHRHTYRDEDWYILQDNSTGKFHRFSPEAYYIIGFMDGRNTLNRIWEQACEHLGDDMPTQDEVINLVSQLHRIDAIQSDLPSDIADLHYRFKQEKRKGLMNILKSPVSIQLPIFDPDRFLNKTALIGKCIFSISGAIIWSAIVLYALAILVIHWNDLTLNIIDRALSAQNLILIWFVYPVLKLFHEFAHAYAVKKWGGEVHVMGIMLLVFMPIPYVDASASIAFSDKRKRMMVGAAGILCELFIAALALIIWVNIEPGNIRAITYNIILVASVSTLLFNGNPLLRFDAYYVVSDYLEIPNMGTRSNQYIGYLLRRYILEDKAAQSPATAKGEAVLMVIYGVAAFIYRIFISIKIIIMVAGKFFLIGILLALWCGFTMLVMPVFRVVKYLVMNYSFKKKQKRILKIILSVVCLLLPPLFIIVPMSYITDAQGVLWPPEQSRIHVKTNGFIKKVVAVSGEKVKAGDPLVICENFELVVHVKELKSKLLELKLMHMKSMIKNRTEADILNDEIKRVNAKLERAMERSEELTINSPGDGMFLLPMPHQDLPGRFVQRGEQLGFVINDSDDATALVIISQTKADRVFQGSGKVESRLTGNIKKIIPSTIKRVVPLASEDLPSMAFSPEGGGDIVLDPRQNNKPKAFERLFQIEIKLKGVFVNRIGERVYVRFEHKPEPLVFRWYRDFRRLLLNKFDI